MSKEFKFFNCLVFVSLIGLTRGQGFCNTDPFVPPQPNLPLPVIENNAQYQAFIERNTAYFGQTEELVEYYDGLANIGIAHEVFGKLTFLTLNYYATDELIIYNPYSRACNVYKLNSTVASFLSPFPTVTIDGSQHILSPLNSILKNTNFKFVYIGKSEIRGIPVDQWQTCVYSDKDKKAFNITVSFSDKSKWKPAQQGPANPVIPNQNFDSIPVEIKILSKSDLASYVDEELYSITKFKPFLDIELEEYETPSGVYCAGRINRRELPRLPESFSFIVQQIEPYTLDQTKGTITGLYEEYNYRYQLFLYAFDKNNSITKEIHDFNTGLKYVYNEKSGECEIRKIGVDDDLDGLDTETSGLNIKLKDPKDFFSFDPEKFQFTGYKRRDGVNTEVWIGPKNLSGVIVFYEWYFLSSLGWNRTDYYNQFQIPIYLKVFLNLPQQNSTDIIQTSKSFHIFDFKENDVFLSDYDISKCDGDLLKDFITFTLNVDHEMIPTIQLEIIRFKSAITRAIHRTARVTVLRISNMQIRFGNDSARVFFTLYEKPKFYGNVQEPEDDVTSRRAIKYLNDSMVYDDFEVEFYVEPIGRIEVNAKNSSIRVIDDYQYESFLEDLEKGVPPANKDNGYSSGLVAFLAILMVSIGLVVGVGITGLEKHQKIRLLKPFYNSS